MDMATLLQMFGNSGAGAAGGMQMPAAQLGAAQMGGPQAAGPGFALGQQLVQPGQPGSGMQMAGQQDPGFMASMMQGQPNAELMAKLGPMGLAMMQGQQQQPQLPQMPMMQMGGGSGQQGQTQASRGYLAQGGGVAPRNLIHRGY